MSIETALANARSKIERAYASVELKGGTVPSLQNLENLSGAIEGIPTGQGGSGENTVSAITRNLLNNTAIGTKVYLEPVPEDPVFWDLSTINGSSYTVVSKPDSFFRSTYTGYGYLDKNLYNVRLTTYSGALPLFTGTATNVRSHTYNGVISNSTTTTYDGVLKAVRLEQGIYFALCRGGSTSTSYKPRPCSIVNGVITEIDATGLEYGCSTLPSGKYVAGGYGLNTKIYEHNNGSFTLVHDFSSGSGSTNMFPFAFKSKFDNNYYYFNPSSKRYYPFGTTTVIGSIEGLPSLTALIGTYSSISAMAFPLDEYANRIFFPGNCSVYKMTSSSTASNITYSLDEQFSLVLATAESMNPSNTHVQFYNGKTYIFSGWDWFVIDGDTIGKLPRIFTDADYGITENEEIFLHKVFTYNFDDMIALGTRANKVYASGSKLYTGVAIKSSSCIDTEFVAVPSEGVTNYGNAYTGITSSVPSTGFTAGALVKADTVLPSDHTWSKVGKVFGYNVTVNSPEKFVQPVLTANGTIGGLAFAVDASSVLSGRDAWKALSSDTSLAEGTEWHSAQGLPQHFDFYNPTPIKVSSLYISNIIPSTTSATIAITAYKIQARNHMANQWVDIYEGTNTDTAAGSTWKIPVNSSQAYRFWRIYIRGSSDNTYATIGKLKIEATVEGAFSLNISKGSYVKSETPFQAVISSLDTYDIPLSELTEGQTTGNINDLYVLGKEPAVIAYDFRICAEGTEPVLPEGFTFAVKLDKKITL